MWRTDTCAGLARPVSGKGALITIVIMCANLSQGVGAIELPVAPEPVGSGARALGQSAFIAVADDATAASWNPAGLVNLEKREASFVGVWRIMSNDPSAVGGSELLDGENWSETEINFMSYAQPFEVGNRDVVLSVNYHQVYDLGLEYKNITEDQTVKSRGAISAYSLAGAVSIPSFPELSIGAAFNWHTRSISNNYVRRVEKRESDGINTETLDDFEGYNFSFGLLWNAYERGDDLLTLGLVCNTPFTAEAYEVTTQRGMSWPEERVDIDFPLTIGGGANYRFSDRFSAALDIEWTKWSDYSYTDASLSPDDVLACRLGCEHLWFSQTFRDSVWALRGGVFYEPRPAWGDTLPVYGFSLGLGWTVKEMLSLDLAYQFRWGGKDDLTVTPENSIDYGIEEHWFISSIVWYL